MTHTAALALMTPLEAQHCVESINAHLNSARALLLELYERQGWIALGYSTWRECVVAEFHQSQAYLYRQLQAAQIEQVISPMGEIGQIPERQLRPLTKLEPGEQQAVWQEVQETAPEGKVTAAYVESVVENRAQSAHRILHSSQSNEWYTPQKYIDAVRQVMGDIDLDPASNVQANQIVQAKVFYAQDDDGLGQVWTGGRVYLNPPYGRDPGQGSNQALWTRKLLEEYEARNVTEAILLVNAATERTWFANLWKHLVCFTNHRINFYRPDGEGESPTIGNAFVYLGNNGRLFAKVFSRFGTVVQRVDHDLL